MWVLSMSERTPPSLSSIVGGFPRRVVQERTQPTEVVLVQVLLLAPQRSDGGCLGVSLPDFVAALGFLWDLSVPAVIVPDSKPSLQEPTRHPQLMTGRSVHETASV